jgi:hypothetical protein
MTAVEILDQLHRRGVHVRASGSQLIVAPSYVLTIELRDLIRENKAALLEALASPVVRVMDAGQFRKAELMRELADNQRGGCLAACERCANFVARPARAPDGWCKRFLIETWRQLPAGCTQDSMH